MDGRGQRLLLAPGPVAFVPGRRKPWSCLLGLWGFDRPYVPTTYDFTIGGFWSLVLLVGMRFQEKVGKGISK